MSGLSPKTINAIVAFADAKPAFRTFGIAFIGRGACTVIREANMPQGYQNWIVLKEVQLPDNTTSSPAQLAPPQPKGNLAGEFLNAGLSCGSAVLAGAAVAGGAAAAPVTAGTSTVVSALAFTGAVASAAQCGISVGRVINDLFQTNHNAILDGNEYYTKTAAALDVIGLIGAAASVGMATKAAIQMNKAAGSPPMIKTLQRMNRPARKRLARELAKYTANATTRSQFIKLARAGKVPKIFTVSAVNRAAMNEFLNVLSAALTVTGSAKSGVIHLYFTE
ncbi:MAG: hypothetical protein AAF828_00690 [Bacteroidota bacterium]